MFKLLLFLISITTGISTNLPFETFSYKLLRNSENHDLPDLSIKTVNNALSEAFETSQTFNLRSKSGGKAG